MVLMTKWNDNTDCWEFQHWTQQHLYRYWKRCNIWCNHGSREMQESGSVLQFHSSALELSESQRSHFRGFMVITFKQWYELRDSDSSVHLRSILSPVWWMQSYSYKCQEAIPSFVLNRTQPFVFSFVFKACVSPKQNAGHPSQACSFMLLIVEL